MMAEAAIAYGETMAERIVAELYRGIVIKNKSREQTTPQFETYDSNEVKEIRICGKVRELEIRSAFNSNIVLQQSHQTGKAALYLPVEWDGIVTMETRPRKLEVAEELQKQGRFEVCC